MGYGYWNPCHNLNKNECCSLSSIQLKLSDFFVRTENTFNMYVQQIALKDNAKIVIFYKQHSN